MQKKMKVLAITNGSVQLGDEGGSVEEHALGEFSFQPNVGDVVEIVQNGELTIINRVAQAAAPAPQQPTPPAPLQQYAGGQPLVPGAPPVQSPQHAVPAQQWQQPGTVPPPSQMQQPPMQPQQYQAPPQFSGGAVPQGGAVPERLAATLAKAKQLAAAAKQRADGAAPVAAAVAAGAAPWVQRGKAALHAYFIGAPEEEGAHSYAARPVGFVQGVGACLKKYGNFSGRASRPEYGFFVLVFFAAAALLAALGALLQGWPLALGLALVGALALTLPLLAVGARRLHDTGKSGWWQAAPIVLLVLAIGLTTAKAAADIELMADMEVQRIGQSVDAYKDNALQIFIDSGGSLDAVGQYAKKEMDGSLNAMKRGSINTTKNALFSARFLLPVFCALALAVLLFGARGRSEQNRFDPPAAAPQPYPPQPYPPQQPYFPPQQNPQ